MNSQKGFAPIIIIVIVVALLGIGAGGYVFLSKQRSVPTTPSSPNLGEERPSPITPSEAEQAKAPPKTPSLAGAMEPPKELLGWWEEVEDWSLDPQTGQLKKNEKPLHFFKEFTDKYYCVQYAARDKCVDNVLYYPSGNKIFLEGSSGFYPYAEWRIIDGKLELKGGAGGGKELYIKISPPTSVGPQDCFAISIVPFPFSHKLVI